MNTVDAIEVILISFCMSVGIHLLLGCPASVCTQLETRCADNVAQICGEGQWVDVLDCDEVEPGSWSCGEEGNEHTCLVDE